MTMEARPESGEVRQLVKDTQLDGVETTKGLAARWPGSV